MSNPGNPHAGQPILKMGPRPDQARLAMILVHGRGASAEDIMGLAREFRQNDVAYLVPQAAGNTWYPYTFLAPFEKNEPALSSALGVLKGLVATLGEQGLPSERVGLLGFSQGACLSLEFAARNARRYAAVVGLSGGLIGPPATPRSYSGSAAGTFVFLGCSDVDPHIPLERVQETSEVFRGLGAVVDERIYRGMGHTVNRDEIEAVRMILGSL
jgi:predicted esterase